MIVLAYTPFAASETTPFATQKSLYVTTYFTVEKIGWHFKSMIPTVIPVRVYYSGFPIHNSFEKILNVIPCINSFPLFLPTFILNSKPPL